LSARKPALVERNRRFRQPSHTAPALTCRVLESYTGIVWLEKVPRALNDWALWEYGGVALLAVGRWLFSRSSQSPNAANEPGMILTPKGWQLDNRRLNAAGALPPSLSTVRHGNATRSNTSGRGKSE